MPDGQETRITDPTTGGQKGSKLARFDLLPWDIIYELAEHFGRGARKYEDRNWERGYDWGLSTAALGRHLAQWMSGEDYDQETGSSHLVAVAWHAICLRWMQRHGKGRDTRSEAAFPSTESRTEPAPEPERKGWLDCWLNNRWGDGLVLVAWTSMDLLRTVAACPGLGVAPGSRDFKMERCWARADKYGGQCPHLATDEEHLFLCKEHQDEMLP